MGVCQSMVEKGEKKTPESHPNPYETIGHSVYAHERREDIFRLGEMMRGNRKRK